ncbi:MAG: hypothetical protein K6L74_08045 [Neptuniibacter sp.]
MDQATWKDEPENNEWNNSLNWSPSEPTACANFGFSNKTELMFSASQSAEIKSIQFSDDATAFTFLFRSSSAPSLIISGDGIHNLSSKRQSFIVAATSSGFKDPQLQFINSASAGDCSAFYSAGPESKQGYGGGVISFCDTATAGSASFKVWTGAGIPPKHSTVGGEVSFSNNSSAGNAHFSIYGTLGTDGDTFGNVVFHDDSTAANANFTNVGGTVSGGDGGNTQFYGNSTAAHGIYNNWGGTHNKANGGDVAFDATTDGGNGYFYNHAAKAAGAYGGVTSFNNNPPYMKTEGASAGHGTYFNYGARSEEEGGGGHLEFSAKYGSPTAASASITNYGSSIPQKSSAGHTIFSINLPTEYFPTAGQAHISNHPASTKNGAAGFTEFSIFGNGTAGDKVPTAGNATLINLGGYIDQAAGGYTVFSGQSNAGNATLIAYGGSNGGYGGRIVFYDNALGGQAKVQLSGNAELDISNHNKGISLDTLEISGGTINIELGKRVNKLVLTRGLTLNSNAVCFDFKIKEGGGFNFEQQYTVMTCDNLADFNSKQFKAKSIDGVIPSFSITGNDLNVCFSKN